jgi:alcohol dehydrogenase
MLDPELAASQPARVRATAGYDAISHALETWVTTARNPLSACFAREAWRLLDVGFERVLTHPDDIEAWGAMMLGAHFAGLAIENSMLGAAHACANPLSERYGTTHGLAVALMLKHVVLWNGVERYEELCGRRISARLDRLAMVARLPRTLREIGVPKADLPQLAEDAAQQWTGQFNPRPLDVAGALELYRCAY